MFSITDRSYLGHTELDVCLIELRHRLVDRMDESADARRILTAVPQSDWRRPVGRPHSSWMATLKNDLSLHNLTYEDAIEMALDKPLWGLLAASGAMH